MLKQRTLGYNFRSFRESLVIRRTIGLKTERIYHEFKNWFIYGLFIKEIW